MTPSFTPQVAWGDLPAATLAQVAALLATLLQEVGHPLARTARAVRAGKREATGLRSLLLADLFGPSASVAEGTAESPRQRFAHWTHALSQLGPGLAEVGHLRGVAAQLDTLEQLRTALQQNDEAALAQAMGIALSIEHLLQDLVREVEATQSAGASRS